MWHEMQFLPGLIGHTPPAAAIGPSALRVLAFFAAGSA
jgi:hypothetical protein